MSTDPLKTAAALQSYVAYDTPVLAPGKVYFELAIDPSLPGPLRQKLSLAAFARIQEMDPERHRDGWLDLNAVPTDPAKMPAFLRNRCLYPLGPDSRVRECLVTQDNPPATTYCYVDDFRVCYHPFILVSPDTGLPLEVHASHDGVEGSAPIQLVLAWMSDPLFPAGSTLAEQALARFEAHRARTDSGNAVTEWPDSFPAGRSARPVGGGAAGRLREENGKCWVDFPAGEALACDLEDGLAADYSLMTVLRPGGGDGKCEVFRAGSEAAGVTVTMARAGNRWRLTGTHACTAGTASVTLNLDGADRYRVLTLRFARDEGLCAFVDADRAPHQADFVPRPGTGTAGDARVGCAAAEGEPLVSIGELLLFRGAIWEETRLSLARHLLNQYAG
jgi:hypothetical protein